MSIVRATVMMLELDYMSSFNEPYFDDKPSTLPYPSLTVFFMLLFVLLMPILLVNLLVSLAALYDVVQFLLTKQPSMSLLFGVRFSFFKADENFF